MFFRQPRAGFLRAITNGIPRADFLTLMPPFPSDPPEIPKDP